MLTVRNLRPEPTVRDWLQENNRLFAGLLLWSAALLWLAGSGPRIVESAWYRVSFVEGAMLYDRMLDEASCKALSLDGAVSCLSGAELGATEK